MKSFRSKVVVWLGSIFLFTMGLILAGFLGHSFQALRSDQRAAMKGLVKQILMELPPVGTQIPKETIDKIIGESRYAYFRGGQDFGVYDPDRNFLFGTENYDPAPAKTRFDPDDRSELYLLGVSSKPDVAHWFSEWHFLFRYQKNGYVVFVQKTGQFELIERLFQGLGISLVMALLLAVPSAYFISRRVLAPLKKVDDAIQTIKEGTLSHRISPLVTDDEFSRLAEAMNETFEELDVSFQRIKRFSGDAAHELRTSLTSMRGILEVALMKERDCSEYRETMNECLDEVIGLSEMVENLLMLTTPGATGRSFEPVNLASVVTEALERLEHVPGYATHTIVTTIGDDLIVKGDRSLLMRLCCNLIQNALKYSDDGTDVDVGARREADTAVFWVRDHGVGIAESDQARIFDRFFQADESHSDGVGLGLSIVQWIVTVHGGTITVESTLGKGSAFTVTIPCTSMEINCEQT